ncbi:lasso peptide biosynthesis B2 protein [Actinophytocola sp.]|uniref:lasso peptide biosynthesis B2 protein n=1 Tax=Actinophytocola sp. TaxID=1872138 RepID=UPI002ED1236B
MSSVRIPRHVRSSVADHGGSVVLNLRTGRWHALNAPARQLWTELCRTGDFDDAVSSIAAGYPAEWRPRIREDAETLLAALSDRRLVVLGPRAEPAPADVDAESARPSTVVTATATATGAEGAERRIRAHVGLVLALLLLRLPFRWTTRTVAWTRRRCRTEATVPEAIGMLLAVDEAARRCPARAACLERSLGAVLTAALCGRRVDWVMGVAEDPYRFHAWLETRGAAVLSAPEADLHTFRRVFVQ